MHVKKGHPKYNAVNKTTSILGTVQNFLNKIDIRLYQELRASTIKTNRLKIGKFYLMSNQQKLLQLGGKLNFLVKEKYKTTLIKVNFMDAFWKISQDFYTMNWSKRLGR